MLDVIADVIDALRGQRMRPQVRVLANAREHLLPLKNLEELQEPARRLPAGVEKSHGRVIGRGLLRHRILHEGALGDAFRGQHGRAAAAAPAGDAGSGAEHHRDDSFDAGVPCRLLKARQVPPGNMAGLMREHPDQLVRSLGAHDEAAVDEFVLAAGDEGIYLLVLDQIDVQRARLEPRRLPDRGYHRANVGFDLGIADNALARGGSLSNDERRRDADCRA